MKYKITSKNLKKIGYKPGPIFGLILSEFSKGLIQNLLLYGTAGTGKTSSLFILGGSMIIHRKGATPAQKGILGIIPGSMATDAFIVEGKGNIASINSASHGAGRVLSRTKAKEKISPSMMRSYLTEKGVELIGGGIDESPHVYKDINQVMRDQMDLINIRGSFRPKIVKMS